VVAMVMGAGGTPGGPGPPGITALAVAARLPKPIVVVPPDASRDGPLRRVLVPIEGARSASLTPQAVIDLAETAEIELIALHVLEQELLPAFTDQPQHEFAAWTQEFIDRYCHWHSGTLRLETRVGRVRDVVPVVAEEVDADLVALAWSQELSSGRASTVRAVLDRCHRPVLLVPVRVPAAPEKR
jgi:nucleotide-binding universal stress UspA family protein